MEYEQTLGVIVSVLTIVGVVFAPIKRLLHLRKSISEELWAYGLSWKIKDYINPQYTVEGWNGKQGIIDKLLAKLLLKSHPARMVFVVGESGAGKSFLCVKILHRLIFRTAMKGHLLKYVNAAKLENFDELEKDPYAKKTILFLDGLDEYHQFLKPHDPQITKDFYNKLLKVLSEYGRVVISARSNYYFANKDEVNRVCYQLAGCKMQNVVKVTLTGLEDHQIRKYLKQNLKLKDDKIEKCIKLVHCSKEILSKPMFLYFLETLPGDINYSNSYKVYEEIVEAWMQHEKDKSVLSSNPIDKVDWGKAFDQLTERYFEKLFGGHTTVFFQPEEVISPQSGIDNSVLGSRALLKYDPEFGYYCIHRSFFEFNYVRLHYEEMCESGTKEEKFMHSSLKTFYEECHYNRTFAPDFPQAEVLLLKSGRKPLSELRPEEAGRMIQIYVMHSDDLLHPAFRKFLQGFYYSSFMLGSWKINNAQLRCLLQNKYLNLSEEKIRSAQALDWFHGLPVCAMNLSHTGIRTLDFLKDFPLLEQFVSVGNSLVDVKGVEQCMNLRYLNLSNCGLTSNALEGRWPESLRKLIVSNNEILNLAFVTHMHLDELDVSDNPLQSGAESFMAIPGRVKCVYHFGSDALKAMILKEKQFTGKEIQYGDLMSFLRDNVDTVRVKDEITSVFGLENICCEFLMLPLGLISSLNTLSKPLHTDGVVILSGHEYKLGYELNELFSNLDFCSRQQMTLEYATKLHDQCDNLLNYFVNYIVSENCETNIFHDALKEMMDTQIYQSCLQEIYLIAAICLKHMWRYGTNIKNQVSTWKIDRLACDYMNKYPVPDQLRLEYAKNLSEQHRKYKEQGKEFERAIKTILSNTRGLSEIIWNINYDCYEKMNITQDWEDDSAYFSHGRYSQAQRDLQDGTIAQWFAILLEEAEKNQNRLC